MSRENDKLILDILGDSGSSHDKTASAEAPAPRPNGDELDGMSEAELLQKLGSVKLQECRDEVLEKIAAADIDNTTARLSRLLILESRNNGTLPGLIKQASQQAHSPEHVEDALTLIMDEVQ